MTIGRLVLLLTVLLVTGKPAIAADSMTDSVVESLIQSGLEHREAGRFSAAETDFRAVVDARPGNGDARLLLALVIGYQGRYDEALEVIAPAIANDPENDDLLLARARLNAWAGRMADARTDVETILARAPDNAEAAELSAWLDRADTETEGRYILSLTGARSDFDRRSVDPWYETRAGLAYRGSGPWSVDGALQRSRRHGSFDHLAELGASYRGDDWGAVTLRGEAAPGADFLPRWGIAGSVQFKAWDGAPGFGFGPGFATLGARHREYADTGVDNLDPGWTQYLGDGSAWVTARRIHVWSDQANGTLTGWSVRGDVSFEPAAPLGIYVLRAKSPETDLGVTVDTHTFAAGVVYGLTDRVDLRLDFARDNRSGSYVRDEWSLGTAVEF